MKYRTAAAFRAALEQRLIANSRMTGVGLARLRKLVVFERLLARLLVVAPNRWVLKGGLALDFRLRDRARATVDMDLARRDDQDAAAADFAAAQRAQLGDHYSFEIARTALLDDADVAGAVRYRVRASLAGRRFEDFIVDVSFADPPVDKPDEVVGPDLLSFAGLPPLHVPTLPLPDHVAEKVHAYTRRYGPHQRPSTRVKDLVDLVLLASMSEFSARDLSTAVRRTVEARGTHSLPATLPEPPLDWDAPYRRLATDLFIPTDRQEAHRVASALLNPILDGRLDEMARWDPTVGAWIAQT